VGGDGDGDGEIIFLSKNAPAENNGVWDLRETSKGYDLESWSGELERIENNVLEVTWCGIWGKPCSKRNGKSSMVCGIGEVEKF